MPLDWTRPVATASTLTSAAATLTSIGFGIAKASTRLGFSIARGVARFTPIPFLSTSLTHLENLSLLPILLGESIACTSFIAASASLDLISNLIDAEDEASFSLTTFVALVRREWAEHGITGRSVTEIARAVAAWAAVQGYTRQWGEVRLLKSVRELTSEDFRPPDKPVQRRRAHTQRSYNRTVSRVSVTEDVIMFGRSAQVVSADIGEKEDVGGLGGQSPNLPQPPPTSSTRRSNFEVRRTFRRLSKMVLAGYGGPGLLFFGVPLRPVDDNSSNSKGSTPDIRTSDSNRTDTEVKKSEEDMLIRVVEKAEAEAEVMSPPLRNINLPDDAQVGLEQASGYSHTISNDDSDSEPAVSSTYSWWNVLLGKHDREIFEGFAFTPADDSDKDSIHTPSVASPTHSRFHSLSKRDSFIDIPTISRKDAPRGHKEPKPPTATIGDLGNMPRFWVLTDHGRQQVVLVVRGTMSYNELAADLHCEPENFEPAVATSTSATTQTHSVRTRKGSNAPFPLNPKASDGHGIPFPTSEGGDTESMPGSFKVKAPSQTHKESSSSTAYPSIRRRRSIFDMAVEPARAWPPSSEDIYDEDGNPRYQVHGGMYLLAREMGSQGKPVHEAVCAALARNKGYELMLCGHSLGAGVAALLALMWADPSTCRTISSSGLPSNRRVSVYCFAPPCIASPGLSRLCKDLIISIVYSYDVVSRLSLGHMRDLNKAAYWLCEGQGEESAGSVLRRALKGKINFGREARATEEEKKWFIALRKTLEANMRYAHLFPPGTVWWAVRDEALHPSHRSNDNASRGIRLFEVLRVEDVFRQIEFKGDMLSAHLPHQYDRMLAELDP